MIRIDRPRTRLLAEIAAEFPTWDADAKKRTAELAAGGGDRSLPSTWSDIKSYYIRLQASKCVYCEKPIEDHPVEQDIEHFRPKRKVTRWPVPRKLANLAITVVQPASGSEPGYPLLADHPLNYGAACLTCNRILKKNYFPIAGVRDYTSSDPSIMAGERPLLLYPISDLDENPEDLIEFMGVAAQARGTGFRRHRALVTIWVFQLNREWLLRERAKEIVRLYLALELSKRRPRDQDVDNAKKLVRHMTSSPDTPYANCMRSFARLYHSDHPAAQRFFLRCSKLVTKVSR